MLPFTEPDKPDRGVMDNAVEQSVPTNPQPHWHQPSLQKDPRSVGAGFGWGRDERIADCRKIARSSISAMFGA